MDQLAAYCQSTVTDRPTPPVSMVSRVLVIIYIKMYTPRPPRRHSDLGKSPPMHKAGGGGIMSTAVNHHMNWIKGGGVNSPCTRPAWLCKYIIYPDVYTALCIVMTWALFRTL